MYRLVILFCVQALLLKDALAYPVNGCNGIAPGIRTPCNGPTIATGNAVTTVGGCLGPAQTSTVPLVTEILPSLQFGDINLAGDIPIGGTIKVSGCFPVYGVVSVDGAVPSAGSALINAGGGLVASVHDPCCRF